MLKRIDDTSTAAQLKALLATVTARPTIRRPEAVLPQGPRPEAPIGGLFRHNRPVTGEAPAGVSMRPWATRTREPAPSFQGAIARVLGKTAIADLQKTFTTQPVVLIAGDQLTGKSTAAKAVAEAMTGKATNSGGTGSVMREIAKERGISIEELSKELAKEPQLDVKTDYRALTAIGKGEMVKDGETIRVASFESRLAGHLGQFLKGLGRENLVTVYLQCSPKERALRYVGREVSEAARARLEPQLDVAKDADLADCLKALGKIDDPAAQLVASKFKEIADRDASDFTRLQSLYGVNYQDTSAFDVVVDTSGKTPAQVTAAVIAAVNARVAAA